MEEQGSREGTGLAPSHREFLDVDPRTLHLPPTRIQGADPFKFARQMAKYGSSTNGMPPLLVIRGKGGALQLVDGVTRACRVAELLPGQTVTVEVIEEQPNRDLSIYPVGDVVP